MPLKTNAHFRAAPARFLWARLIAAMNADVSMPIRMNKASNVHADTPSAHLPAQAVAWLYDLKKPMQRLLIIAGILLVVAGLAWPWLSRLPLGRLPGDIHIVREGFSFYFPITTGLLVSVVLTLLLWLFR